MGAAGSKKKKNAETKTNKTNKPKSKKQSNKSNNGKGKSEKTTSTGVVRKKTLVTSAPTINPKSLIKKDRNIKQFYKISGFSTGNMINMEIKKCVEVATGKTRSVKIINKALISDLDKKQILYEMQILKLIQHPHIGKIHDFKESSHYYYVVIDFLKENDLLTHMTTRTKPITEIGVRNLMRQILSAVSLLHKEGIIHGDLQAQRISCDDKIAKIADFSSIKDVQKIIEMNRGMKLSYYCPPEMHELGLNARADEWGCGMICYLLVTGKPPFDTSAEDFEEKVKSGKLDYPIDNIKGLSENGKEVLKALLTIDYNFRPSAEQILQYKWFDQKYDKNMEKNYFKNTVKEMKKYQFKNKLQEAIYLFMSKTNSSQATKQQMLETFQKIDKDGDGYLTRKELLTHFDELDMNYTKDEVNHLFDLMDIDGDNQVSFDEFVAATVNKDKMLTEQNIFNTFKRFDKDQNGKIEIAEFFEVLNENNLFTTQEVEEHIKDIDYNGDGHLDFQEFTQMLKDLAKKIK